MDTEVKSLRNENGELIVNLEALLVMARCPHPSKDVRGWRIEDNWEVTPDGLLYQLSYAGSDDRNPLIGPFHIKEARKEARQVMVKARQWIHQNLRGFKRHIKLNSWNSVQLWKFSQQDKTEIIRCKPGEVVVAYRILENRHIMVTDRFLRREPWGYWEVFGAVKEKVVDSMDYGLTREEAVEITFNDGPAVVCTAAGDSLYKGRLFYRQLYVAE